MTSSRFHEKRPYYPQNNNNNNHYTMDMDFGLPAEAAFAPAAAPTSPQGKYRYSWTNMEKIALVRKGNLNCECSVNVQELDT